MRLFDGLGDNLKSRRQKAVEEAKELRDLRDKTEFEKGDYLALIIAAVITILPVVLIILYLYYAISKFFFG